MTTAIRLLAIDARLAAATGDATAFAQASGASCDGPELELIRGVVEQTLTLYERAPRAGPWLCYLAIEAEGAVVGSCGFVAGPGADRAVEIAYFTFPPHERRGYGALMAGALVALARRVGGAERACAHTLRESNASTRILEKLGFSQVGEADDADAGRVWRWELAL